MNFCSLVLELHLPQNFCHTHTDTQTHRQTFSRNSQIVFRTSQNVTIHQKPEIENLHETDISSTYIEESKNSCHPINILRERESDFGFYMHQKSVSTHVYKFIIDYPVELKSVSNKHCKRERLCHLILIVEKIYMVQYV